VAVVVVSPAVGCMAVAAVAAAAVGVAAAWAENKMVNITNLSILYRTYRSVPDSDLQVFEPSRAGSVNVPRSG